MSIELSYVHTSLFLSWYFIFFNNLLASALCIAITEFNGSVWAFSIDIIFILDCINVPCVFISAIARYLLSFDISVSNE